jgi:hypothetical protein
MSSLGLQLADPRQRAIAPPAALAEQASLTRELIQLYSNYFSPGRPVDWLHLNGRGRVFSNELVVIPLDVNTPKGMQVFPPMVISGLKFIFDLSKPVMMILMSKLILAWTQSFGHFVIRQRRVPISIKH